MIHEAVNKHRTFNSDFHLKCQRWKRRNVRVILKWSNNVNIAILYGKEQSFLDLIIYTSSSVGLWFGLSVNEIFCKFSHYTCAKKHHKSNTTSDSTSKQIRQLKKALEALEEKSKLDHERMDKSEKENELLTEVMNSCRQLSNSVYKLN